MHVTPCGLPDLVPTQTQENAPIQTRMPEASSGNLHAGVFVPDLSLRL